MNGWILFCRAGFEKECAAEVEAESGRLGVNGRVEAVSGSGTVVFEPEIAPAQPQRLFGARHLVFARQAFWVFEEADVSDRKSLPTVIADKLKKSSKKFFPRGAHDALCEVADTEEGKRLWPVCRETAGCLTSELTSQGLVSPKSTFRLHIFFKSRSHVLLGLSDKLESSPWPMGIPRLRLPSSAPSRSTLKLEEAFLFFLSETERAKRLKPGMRAVDLGAAPGGWTWQLTKRGLVVEAVDNGPMDRGLLNSGLVEHLKADGFVYRPSKPVHWMVCDMVAKPSRVANLIASWAVGGYCMESIFNLKLPMKKRLHELNICRRLIENRLKDAGISYTLRFKHFYRDREEVTGHLCLGDGAAKGRNSRRPSKRQNLEPRRKPRR